MPENAFLRSDVKGSVHTELRRVEKNCLRMKEELDATQSGQTTENTSQG